MGRYGDILGQNHKILLKNRQILEKMSNEVYSIHSFPTATMGLHIRNHAGFLGEIDELLLIWVESYDEQQFLHL
jgi:hypothetical protein